MIQSEFIIANQLGIHARPASYIVKLAMKFKSSIVFKKDGAVADAKSIMSIMMLAASCGAKVSIEVSGEDEKDAFDAMSELFSNKFNEE